MRRALPSGTLATLQARLKGRRTGRQEQIRWPRFGTSECGYPPLDDASGRYVSQP